MIKKHIFDGSHGKITYVKIDGEKNFATIVFMDGFGGANNYLGLKNTAKRIDNSYTKLFIDRLGVSESDETNVPRTWNHIVFEIHELIERVIQKPIIFFAHSASGPLALAYSSVYPDEVLGIIGIEPTTKMGDTYFQDEDYKKAIAWMDNLSTEERNQLFIDPEWTEEERLEENRTTKHIIEGSTLYEELLMGNKNLDSISKLPKPSNLPILLFLQPFREKEYQTSEYSGEETNYVLMEGHHALHRVHPDEIANHINAWFRALNL